MEFKFETVFRFWFEELESKQWFVKDPALDNEIKSKFGDIHKAATRCELYHWREEPQGALCEVIVLDQFSRNIFRDQARAFAYDDLALALAQCSVARGDSQHLKTREKSFLFMPYMHSESLAIHEQAVELFSQPGLESNLDYEHRHKKIIERFGRYPHRNEILNRQSSADEVAFLKEPGSSF